jgi:PPK2 family polyphosphate:nucleotide phosphotransferase
MEYEDLRIRPGHDVTLAKLDPDFTDNYKSKRDAAEKLKHDVRRLAKLQDIFAAARSHALLIVLQGMDTAGKDGVIKHVMSGVNPQGIDVHSFKAPTEEEVLHDFLWRCAKVLPERGRIGIFNRSHYEETLVVRVHRELLAREEAIPKHHVWSERFEDINAFERHLVRSGTVVLKFFLNISKDEQRKRLLKRLDNADKVWKFSLSDAHERHYWDQYTHAYEQMLEHTSTTWAPWYVIPADHKWFSRVAVASVLVSKLEELGLRYPSNDAAAAAELQHLRSELETEP